MTTEPWTPGPWTWHDADSTTEPLGEFMSGTLVGDDSAYVVGVSTSDELYVRPADARLIALAPEMAEFIAGLLEYGFKRWEDTVREADALLARARGETA